MVKRSVLVLGVLAACGQDKIEVRQGPSADYNHRALLTAVDTFVAAGRTPEAYGELAQTVSTLRPGMDSAVARDAELKLIVLALGPIHSVAGKPFRAQLDALALTVWPTLLAPEIEEDKLLVVRDPKAPQLVPKPGEDAVSLVDENRDRAVHARLQHALAIVEVHEHRKHRHVLLHDRLRLDLLDVAGEAAVRIGVDGDVGRLARMDVADVALVAQRANAHDAARASPCSRGGRLAGMRQDTISAP